MFSSFTVNAIGVLALVLFGVFYWLGILPTTRAVLAFTGTCLVTTGFLAGAVDAVASWLTNIANSATGWATGIEVGGTALVIVTGVVFVHDLMPKHTAGKRTGWAGVLLAALLVIGASGIPALNNIPAGVRNAVASVQSVLGG